MLPTQNKIKVLVVEDDFLVSLMVQRMVEEIGYEVAATANNGNEAVERTKEIKPDIVLMDIKMTDMDGIEAAKIIQKEIPTPVVMLTAHETPELLEQASDAGVGAYLVKPVNVRELENAITISKARFQDMQKLREVNLKLEQRNADLEKALSHIKTLTGLLPICASCKKIRDDSGYWHQVEAYVQDHSDAEFSHGLCPDCVENYYSDLINENDGS
jgi:AmiR/NasT family two-component response regulator